MPRSPETRPYRPLAQHYSRACVRRSAFSCKRAKVHTRMTRHEISDPHDAHAHGKLHFGARGARILEDAVGYQAAAHTPARQQRAQFAALEHVQHIVRDLWDALGLGVCRAVFASPPLPSQGTCSSPSAAGRKFRICFYSTRRTLEYVCRCEYQSSLYPTIRPPRACSHANVVDVRAAPRRRVRSEKHLRARGHGRSEMLRASKTSQANQLGIETQGKGVHVPANWLVGSLDKTATAEGVVGVDADEAVCVHLGRGRDCGANHLEYRLDRDCRGRVRAEERRAE
jgi:hypothetical protein